MMKKITFIALGAIMTLASCSTITPVTATENAIGDKVGTSKNSCMFSSPLIAPGEGFVSISNGVCFNQKKYGVIDAAKKGGINKVATVDLKRTNYILFTTYELIVTGE